MLGAKQDNDYRGGRQRRPPLFCYMFHVACCVIWDYDKRMKTKFRNWTKKVTEESNALDLEGGVFTWKNSRKIALSLKWSAENSKRRKGGPFQSAMSMLNFYINRAGKNLSVGQKKILTRAKEELRKAFNS